MTDTSTNLSKIQRERLLNICSRVKNKEAVEVAEIAELEQFIKSMKYGLTFEKHEEPVDAMLRTHIPVFKEFKEIINNPANQIGFAFVRDVEFEDDLGSKSFELFYNDTKWTEEVGAEWKPFMNLF